MDFEGRGIYVDAGSEQEMALQTLFALINFEPHVVSIVKTGSKEVVGNIYAFESPEWVYNKIKEVCGITDDGRPMRTAKIDLRDGISVEWI